MAAPSTWARMTRRGERPVLLGLRSSTSLIVFTVAMAIFTDLFPYAVIVPVMPFALPSRAGVPQDQVQYWMSISLAAFGAAILVFSPLWGYVADRIQNRQAPMIAGLLLLAASTLLLALMHDIPMLLAGRVLQGMTGSLTWSVGLALIVDTVDQKGLGVAMGWIGAAMSCATLAAPLLGGVVYGKGGWYQVWAMCFALIAGDVALRLVIIEKKHVRKWQSMDTERAEARSHGDAQDKPQPQGPLPAPHDQSAAGPRAAKPSIGFKSMLPLFRNPRLLAALWGCLVEAAVQTAFDAIIPLQVESLFGWDSIGAGLVFLPFILPMFLGPAVGWLGDRYGAKWLTASGFFLATPFLACLRFVTEDSMAHRVLLCGLLFGVGVGMACTIGPVLAEITWSFKSEKQQDEPEPIALAYALYNIAFAGGALIGPLLGGFIRDSAGWQTVGWSLAILSCFTGVTSLLWLGGPLSLGARRWAGLWPLVLLHHHGRDVAVLA